MNDWITVIISTVVAPGLAALMAYAVTMRKERADINHTSAQTNGEQASTAEKYRNMLNDEIARRKIIGDECEEAQDALKQCVEENSQLRDENVLLRRLLSANHISYQDVIKPVDKLKGTP